MKEKEFLAYEKGFEDGYAMARRLYEPYCVEFTTKLGLPVRKLLKPTPPTGNKQKLSMNTTTMRDRFDEAFIKLTSNKTMSGFVLNCDPEFAIDFIEQELKKEREEIVEIAETHRVHGDNSRNWEYVNACEDIINTIKNRV